MAKTKAEMFVEMKRLEREVAGLNCELAIVRAAKNDLYKSREEIMNMESYHREMSSHWRKSAVFWMERASHYRKEREGYLDELLKEAKNASPKEEVSYVLH